MEPKRTLHSGNLVRCICAGGELLDFKGRGQRRKLQLIIIARDYKEMAKMREWRADRVQITLP